MHPAPPEMPRPAARSRPATSPRRVPALRLFAAAAALAALSACASRGPQVSAQVQAAHFAASAPRGGYYRPGPAGDPWGPYIDQASNRFDIPAPWIRAVMHVESGGHEYLNGRLTTSASGAMGLMQVMPDTYETLRLQYGLGRDPYDPQNNIMAGAAYIREMYDLFGSPGFLAAYNAGPERMNEYLDGHVALPDETRRYVAMIAPRIRGIYPAQRSPADQYAMTQVPAVIPPGPRFAQARPAPVRAPAPRPIAPVAPVRMAALPAPPRYVPARPAPASFLPPRRPAPPPSAGFRLISPAMADTLPLRPGGPLSGSWAIQVGAYANATEAHLAVIEASAEARSTLLAAHPVVMSVRLHNGIFWRARMVGLSRSAAIDACRTLAHGRTGCIVLSPAAQG